MWSLPDSLKKERVVAIVTGTPTVAQDLMEQADERELWIVGKEMERPPYFHVGKGGDTRLARALRLCLDGRITPNSDGSYTVEGSEHRTYRVTESCSCPNSQKASSKYCYHFVGVCLYIEWQRRLRPVAPVVLGTLRAGTLPLPPVTVEERLAAAVDQCVTHAIQEDRMPDTDDGYIPEPEETPVAVLEPVNGISHDTPMANPLSTALAQWSAQRQVVKEFLRRELHEGTDYYTLQIRGKATKPSLSKAGAEKFLGLLQLQASFAPDLGTWEMLGKPTDQILYVCQLRTRSGEIVGEGRGARSLKQDGGDINKALKMSEKSALIDAVLRTGALSDAFTQDLGPDDEREEPAKPTTPARPTSQDLRARIWAKVQALAPDVKTREACEAYIKEHTGMDLHPDFYQAIVNRLEEQGR
jgi:hypothetical protein